MWQLVFANITIQGWVIDTDQHGFSDGSGSCFGLPCTLCWNFPETLHDQWCHNGHIWVMVLWCALWVLQQMFCLTPLYIHPHNPSCCTYICKSSHSSLVCYPCLLGELGAPWWYWLLWKTLICHVFCRCSCSFHSILSCRPPLCKVYSYCLSSYCSCFN